jgi:hypothetical protein
VASKACGLVRPRLLASDVEAASQWSSALNGDPNPLEFQTEFGSSASASAIRIALRGQPFTASATLFVMTTIRLPLPRVHVSPKYRATLCMELNIARSWLS